MNRTAIYNLTLLIVGTGLIIWSLGWAAGFGIGFLAIYSRAEQ